MRVRPSGFDERRLPEEMMAGWGTALEWLEFVPEGFGSYHWRATTSTGSRLFLTVDDLDSKPWLGRDRESVFVALASCFMAAVRLRDSARLSFVLAPVQDHSGSAVRRLTQRYTLAVFPFLDGTVGDWGDPLTSLSRSQILDLLGELHAAPPTIAPDLALRGLELPGRADLQSVLADLDIPWGSGPYGEDCRRLLGWHVGEVVTWLDTYDRLAGELASDDLDPVITHGEPHPGNLLRRDGRLYLIDWDTVALARPERDLWMLDGPGVATPPSSDPRAVEFYRISWALQDIASFVSVLRAPHEANADTAKTYRSLEISLETGGNNTPWT